jgi:hypothetical protein
MTQNEAEEESLGHAHDQAQDPHTTQEGVAEADRKYRTKTQPGDEN